MSSGEHITNSASEINSPMLRAHADTLRTLSAPRKFTQAALGSMGYTAPTLDDTLDTSGDLTGWFDLL